MPAIENVARRSAVDQWRRRVRFAGKLNGLITITITVNLLTKNQAIARRRGAAMTGHSEVVRVSLYDCMKQQGLTSEQTETAFREEMIRYRNMLAYQEVSSDRNGVEDRAARSAQMLSIYAAFNCDFATNGFADYLGVDYIGSFDQRFLISTAGPGNTSMQCWAGLVVGSLRASSCRILRRGLNVRVRRAQDVGF